MKLREYAQGIRKHWSKEIAQAEKLVEDIEADPMSHEGDYFVQLDPEDFLDLCAGKWHGS